MTANAQTAEATPRRIRRRKPSAANQPPAAAALKESLEPTGGEENDEQEQRTSEQVRMSLKAMQAQLNSKFIARDSAVHAIVLATLTGMNFLLVGGHGTGKTALAESAYKHIKGARYFAPSALGAYTTLSDIVGERDIPQLMQGVSKRQTRGKLAAVEFAFLDELLKAADPTCNTLLSLMNKGERKFDGKTTPLWSVGAATNWPEVLSMKPVVQAFWDRLHFRVVIENVKGRDNLRKLMRSGRELEKDGYNAAPGACVTYDEVRSVHNEIKQVVISESVEGMLMSIHERLLAEKVRISERRLVQLQFVLQASAWLDGRGEVGLADFRHMLWCVWTRREDLSKAKSIIDTVDAEFCRALVKGINTAREMHRDFSSRNWTPERAHEFLMKSSEVADRVADALESGQLTKKSENDVRTAVHKLQLEVETIMKRFGEELGIE